MCPPGSIALDSLHSSPAIPRWSSAGRALHKHRPQESAQRSFFPDCEILASPLPRSSPLEVIRILQPGGLCEAMTSEGRRRRRRQLPAAISHLGRQRAGSARTGPGTCTGISTDRPGDTFPGREAAAVQPARGRSSKEKPTAPLFSLKPPNAVQVAFDQIPRRAAHEGHGPRPRILCTSPSTGPVKPEGPTSGNTHSSTPPALHTPRSPNRRDRRQPRACCCSGEPQHFAQEPALATLPAPPRCAACPQAGLRRELEPVHPAATGRAP